MSSADRGLPPRIAIASRNPGKIREIERICSSWGVEWLTAERHPAEWPAPEETGQTYLENAREKAYAVAAALAIPSLADDSGIEVDALGGGPGPRSARFAGPEASEAANLEKLIRAMAAVPEAGRTARYRCVAVLAWPDGRDAWAEATCEGRLTAELRGSGGFGYDPIFVPAREDQTASEDRTMAELSDEEKDRISHRGKALRALHDKLEARSR